MDKTLSDIWTMTLSLIYSVGGPAIIIIGLSRLIADHWSKSTLVSLQSEHDRQLEKLKSQLDQARTQFVRYSEKQFDLYNSLWLILNQTKELADSLWEDATRSKLPAFADQIRQTRRAVTDNMLLIEDSHYKSLDKLLKQFENFKFGKQKLVDIRPQIPGSNPVIVASDTLIKSTIDSNKKTKDRYTKLIMEVGKSFRKQIKG